MDIALPLVGGLIVLVAGAELLVRGSVRLAERAGVSPLLVGLVVVGFGTSTPELMTSVGAALFGSPGIAVGNIVGSNIFTLLLILGAAALLRPLPVASTALFRDGLWMAGAAMLLALVGWLWALDRIAGALLLALLAAYIAAAYGQERRVAAGGGGGHTAAFDKAEAFEGMDPALEPRQPPKSGALSWAIPLLLAGAGLALLLFGASQFVSASIELARDLGVSEPVIGLTIVAAGTSMPEVAASTIAVLRRQPDVALGNVLGSNIYNSFGIGGVTALIAPTAVPERILMFDSLVMVVVSLLVLVMMWTGRRLSRAEGFLLVAVYAAYLWSTWPA